MILHFDDYQILLKNFYDTEKDLAKIVKPQTIEKIVCSDGEINLINNFNLFPMKTNTYEFIVRGTDEDDIFVFKKEM